MINEIADNFNNTIKNRINNLDTDVRVGLIKSIHPGDKEGLMDESFKNRALIAGISGISAFAASSALARLMNANNKLSNKIIIASSLTSALAGASVPGIYNDYILHKNNEMSSEEFRNKMLKNVSSERGFLHKTAFPNLAKPIIGGARLLTKGVGKALSTFGSGLAPVRKNAPLGKKVLGFTAKGVTLAGAGMGLKSGVDFVQKPRSEGNYNTHLRNNMMSGNLSSGELSNVEKQQVGEIGFR